MPSIWEEFQQKTHISPSYFLTMVLKFIDPKIDIEDLGNSSVSWTNCMDVNGKTTAMIRVTENTFEITRVSNQIKGQ